MRTNEPAIEQWRTGPRKRLLDVLVNRAHLVVCGHAAGNDRLVGYHDEFETGSFDLLERFGDAGEDVDLIGAADEIEVIDEDAIAIEKNSGGHEKTTDEHR